MWIDVILLVITFLVIAIFSSLRVYALADRNWKFPFLILIFGLVLPVAILYQQTTLTVLLQLTDCVLATASRSAAIASDLLVVIVTIWKTKGAISRANVAPLSIVILRDGTFYFVVLLLFNVADIIMLQVAINGAVADLVTALSVILISRFILNLRTVDMALPPFPTGTSLSFANNVIFSLGGPLEYEDDDNSWEDDPGGGDEGVPLDRTRTLSPDDLKDVVILRHREDSLEA
ncbi:hypothetical protein A0H81_12198 [Grifola frondosa]|uniref:Uncharacterized protein n=1 Tax=Grifola frondosa TaxID=5627 RepID=A0A1C7LTZ7_GRIFR|nr:hypothetical protein A0H81_12198 [Grifola frondosa]